MSGIFISYRRDDGSGWTGRLASDLSREFPALQVFQDIDSIGIGEDFVEVMRRYLESCAVAIVVIGPRWLDAKDREGRRRLDDPEDWVRLEVEEFLKRSGLRVVPVLVGGADMPRGAELPESIRSLARRNAHEITDRRWNYDVSQLVRALTNIAALGSNAASIVSEGRSPAVPPTPQLQPESDSRNRAQPATDRFLTSAVAPTRVVSVHTDASAPRPLQSETEPDPLQLRQQEPEARGRISFAQTEKHPHEMRPGTVFRDGDDCPEMVVIPAGTFMMGSPDGENDRRSDEGPQRSVTIARPFAVGKFEVTFEEWDACVAAGGCQHRPSDQGWGRGRQPVINVSWEDAHAYVKWLSNKSGKAYRLLSNAEWEYAARSGSNTRYPWGNELISNLANFDGSGSSWSNKHAAPVGAFAANPFGLYDMIGNVWEWTQDCWNDNYMGAPTDGTAWEDGDCDRRVVRGGAWDLRPELARVAFRFGFGPGIRNSVLGFRLARAL